MLRLTAAAITALSILSTFSTSKSIFADELEWPGWRGPKHDGWVSNFNPPTSWPQKLESLWQIDVGTGYGSPVVSGDSIFVHTRQGEDEVVRRLDLKTGDVKWRKSYNVPFKIGGGGERHGKGPKSSPVLADGRLFTMSITGILSAWETTSGDLLWQHDYSNRFKKGHLYWGTSTSPLVDGNRVIAHFGTDGQGTLIAHDVKSGEEVWNHGNDGPSYSSPIMLEIDGVRQIVELTQRALISVDGKSGRLLWEYYYPQVETNQNMVTPAFYQGVLLLGGENRGLYGLQPRLEAGSWKVRESWFQPKIALDMSSAVINDGLLFGLSHYGSGRIFCLDPMSGKVLWQSPGRVGNNVMFLSIPGHIVALINNGELQIIAAKGDRYDKVASYRVASDDTWAPPVMLKGGVLIKDLRTLTRWSFSSTSE